jgi:hypothetical protein
MSDSNVELSRFPSGRSVGNCRNDAKRLSKREGIPLHEALNRIAAENGSPKPWDRAIADLVVGISLVVSDAPRPLITLDDVRAILVKHPLLTRGGIGVPIKNGARWADFGREFDEKIAGDRASLLRALPECERACEFLRHVKPRKTINRNAGSSYGLKHAVEFYQRHRVNPPEDCYVANGAFICAAVHMGFRYERPSDKGPNVWFNMSLRSPVFEWRRLFDRRFSEWRDSQQSQKLRQLGAEVGALVESEGVA